MRRPQTSIGKEKQQQLRVQENICNDYNKINIKFRGQRSDKDICTEAINTPKEEDEVPNNKNSKLAKVESLIFPDSPSKEVVTMNQGSQVNRKHSKNNEVMTFNKQRMSLITDITTITTAPIDEKKKMAVSSAKNTST